jgi:hypothetical protein
LMATTGAFAPARARPECPLSGQANPPNKDRQGSKAEIQTGTLPLSPARNTAKAAVIRRPRAGTSLAVQSHA